jgi:hypothetical protein
VQAVIYRLWQLGPAPLATQGLGAASAPFSSA